MRFALLASGSKGNCFLLRDENTFLMIDCGTTKKYLAACFEQLGVKKEDLDAVFLTHDHTDHISQVRLFRDRVIYSPVPVSGADVRILSPGEKVQIEHITVTPIPLSHDSGPTFGYIFETWDRKLVYITDTGYLKTSFLPLIRDADYYILESNHDVGMLMETSRPRYLKARIFSDAGHLNNEDCASILEQVITNRTRMAVLAHISQEANTREKALETVCGVLETCPRASKGLIVCAAGQYEILKGGDRNEEVDPGTVSRVIGMEHFPERKTV